MHSISQPMCGCAGVSRYGILVLGVLFLSILQSCVIAFNAAYVPMMDKSSSPCYSNSTTLLNNSDCSSVPLADRRLHYGFLEKSLTFAGAYVGSMIGTLPINILIRRFGAHKVMTVLGLLSSLLTALTPIISTASFPCFVVLRIISGLPISNLFPVAGLIVNEWATTAERGIFVAVLSGYVELSALFTMPISGLVATKVGWPSVFFLHAAVCFGFTVLWALYYRDHPRKHPFVAADEKSIISFGKPSTTGKVKHPTGRILRSLSIWAVWAAVIGSFLVAQFSISFSPIYLNYVLGYEPLTAGFITIAPLALLLLIKILTGLLSDRLRCLSELTKLRLFNTIALVGSALFFLLLTFAKPVGHVGDVILLVLPISLIGFSSGGYPRAVVMVARQHSPFVMSVVQIIACLSLTVGSFVVPSMTSDDSFDQWKSVFVLYAAVLVVCNTIFIMLAKSDPAKWTTDEESISSNNLSTVSQS